MKLKKEELMYIEGGTSISGTLLNAIAKLGTSIMDAGRAFGSALRRLTSRNICSCR